MKQDKNTNGQIYEIGGKEITTALTQHEIAALQDYVENANICMHWVN